MDKHDCFALYLKCLFCYLQEGITGSLVLNRYFLSNATIFVIISEWNENKVSLSL